MSIATVLGSREAEEMPEKLIILFSRGVRKCVAEILVRIRGEWTLKGRLDGVAYPAMLRKVGELP